MPLVWYSFLHGWHLSYTASNACALLHRNIYINQRLGANAYGVSSLTLYGRAFISAALFLGTSERFMPLTAV